MSASSNCVTCWIITQLRARLAPEIFLMRDSGFASTAPNLAKSTSGTFGKAEPPAPAAAPGRSVRICFTWALTSSWVIRPLGPVPPIRPRSAPSSRANFLTEGLA